MAKRENLFLATFLFLILGAFCWFRAFSSKDTTTVLTSALSEVEALKDRVIKSEVEDLKMPVNLTHQEEVTKWSENMVYKENHIFSQNGEDGVIEAVFDFIGTTDKVYVEFGVESCVECNSKYLRDVKGWDIQGSLLMDGGYENPEINLKKVFFWPDNILDHFKTFGVKKQFDFLSVDTDSYDFFMLEAILEADYRPRAIMIEMNAHFEADEAKSIMPPADGKSWERWDETAYHGVSLLAIYYLFNRFNYSMVWCNKTNCIGVLDSELGFALRRPPAEFYGVRTGGKACDTKKREAAVIDPSGKWTGATDLGQGSPMIRC